MTLENAVLTLLWEEDMPANELAEELELDVQSVSDVMARLKDAGLLNFGLE